jgi:hypothetical protein
MIPKYTPEEKARFGKNAYYISLSALQKCIRRGHEQEAVNFAKVAWRIEPYKMFARLWTILYEDCGRDSNALIAFYRYKEGYSKLEPLLMLVSAMCRAGKSRESCYLSHWMVGRDIEREIFKKELENTPHYQSLTDLIGRYHSSGMEVYDIWDFGVGNANFDWTIELADRSTKWDREQMGLGSPYFFTMIAREPAQAGTDECGPCTFYNGWLPLEAIDVHTRPGQHAVRAVLKYRAKEISELPLSLDYENFGSMMFIWEGWKYRNYQPYRGLDFELLGRKMDFWQNYNCSGVAALQHLKPRFDSLLPEINQCRSWLLGNDYKNEVDLLKEAYFDNFIKI